MKLELDEEEKVIQQKRIKDSLDLMVSKLKELRDSVKEEDLMPDFDPRDLDWGDDFYEEFGYPHFFWTIYRFFRPSSKRIQKIDGNRINLPRIFMFFKSLVTHPALWVSFLKRNL